MKEKLLIYLLDDKVILYNQSFNKVSTLTGAFEGNHSSLEKYLTSKTSLYLLIDQSHQDIYEEKLPPLFPWDLIRLLYYKKASYATQGGYGGFQLIKQSKETYVRWAHIPENDPRTPWISWVISRSGQVLFASLEGRRLLNYHLLTSKPYQMLLYPLPSQKMRHVIFKGKRLLLSRLSEGDEDIKSSLHFLSRHHPDIYDNIEVLSLGTAVSLQYVKVLSTQDALLRFVASQKKPSFPLQAMSFSKQLWMRRGMAILLTILIFWMGIETYQWFEFKRERVSLFTEIHTLKTRLKKLPTPKKERTILQKALDQYAYLKPYQHNPLKDFEDLSALLKAHPIHMENVKWTLIKKREIILTFLMKEDLDELLPDQLDIFISAIQTAFPGSQTHILEAPYHSSPHETFNSPAKDAIPLASVKIQFP